MAMSKFARDWFNKEVLRIIGEYGEVDLKSILCELRKIKQRKIPVTQGKVMNVLVRLSNCPDSKLIYKQSFKGESATWKLREL